MTPATHGLKYFKRVIKGMVITVVLGIMVTFHKADENAAWGTRTAVAATDSLTRDDTKARQAFLAAFAVFSHPRCLNCHPAEGGPLQGEASVPHLMNVKRGTDGRGKFAMKCSTCHQLTNQAGANMPPGAPDWHMPPQDTPMAFQNKTPGELCRQLKDPAQNGGKTLDEIIHHISEDKLVMWGWNPGDGRTPIPMNHETFVKHMTDWVRYGAACPE